MRKLMILLLSVIIFAGCKDPGGSSGGTKTATENSGFGSATNPGDTGVLTVGSETLNMQYAQDQANVTFPTETDDSSTQTLTTKFFISETEVTNAVVAEVYQWACDNNRFNTTNSGAHNYLSTTTVKHGGQELLDLDDGSNYCKINYDGNGHFTVDNGYDDHPVVNISWYGAIMFCNWLTEMRDGNTDNLVYGGIDTSWDHTETTEDISKNGYRLPGSYEWEYAARYRSDSTNAALPGTYSNPWYTKGNSASDATADYNNSTATGEVAWYSTNSGNLLHAVKEKRVNDLGLFDMSGNVLEWCFTQDTPDRVARGGSWDDAADTLRVGNVNGDSPDSEGRHIGFRLCRTR